MTGPANPGRWMKRPWDEKGLGWACLPDPSPDPQPRRKSPLVIWKCPFQQHPCGSSDVCNSCSILGIGIYFAKLWSHWAFEQPELGMKSKLWGLELLKLKKRKKKKKRFQVQRKKHHQALGWKELNQNTIIQNSILKISLGKVWYLWVKLSF